MPEIDRVPEGPAVADDEPASTMRNLEVSSMTQPRASTGRPAT
ncbi:MAG: hypothetical protein R2713_21940 [Ilumatobacteraceae bacterium]